MHYRMPLSYFKQNCLHHDRAIVLGNITENLLSLSDNGIEKYKKVETSLEENGNPLDSHRFNSQETMFLSITSVSDEIDIAPGVGRLPISNLSDDVCEELAFSYFFP